MPRQPRRDAPGTIHHVMIRGVAKRPIFLDDIDRSDFVARAARILPEEAVRCHAWALMPNHVHLVLRSGPRPVSRTMARLGTGYAGGFNRRHDRVGHLFQNRFRSERIDDDAYLRTVVRYVHRNPLRSGSVCGLADLESYPWTGHAELMGLRPARLIDVAEVLSCFGGGIPAARRSLRAWMQDTAPGLPLSPEGALRDTVEWVSRRFGVTPEAVQDGSLRSTVVRARSLAIHLARERLGMSVGEIAELWGLEPSTVSRAAERGRKEEDRWDLRDFPMAPR